MPATMLLVLCTCPNRENAMRIADALLERRLAACVNISQPVTSLYVWEGQRETGEEVIMLIKTTAARYQELERTLSDIHPYELPEIIAVPVEQGLRGYLQWVEQCTKLP